MATIETQLRRTLFRSVEAQAEFGKAVILLSGALLSWALLIALGLLWQRWMLRLNRAVLKGGSLGAAPVPADGIVSAEIDARASF